MEFKLFKKKQKKTRKKTRKKKQTNALYKIQMNVVGQFIISINNNKQIGNGHMNAAPMVTENGGSSFASYFVFLF